MKSTRPGQFSNQAGCPYGVLELATIEHSPQAKTQVVLDGGLGRATEEDKNTSSALLVWTQQKAHFEAKDDDCCPMAIFSDDILKEVCNWKEEGDQIVLGIDANADVRTGKLPKAS